MNTTSYREGDLLSSDDLIFATFLLEDLEFAIDVAFIQDAIPVPEHIIPLPASPDYIAGIMDLRGTILPIIDTRKRFRMAPRAEPNRGYIAVTHCKGRYMGLIFDRIQEIVRVKEDSIAKLAPEFQVEGDLLHKIIKLENSGRLVQVIDPSSLFDYKDLPAQLGLEVDAKKEKADWSPNRQIVAFEAAGQLFGIAVEDVREIITVPEISQRILVEDYIKGVISLRSELLSVIDLGAFLGDEPASLLSDSRIIILNIDGLCFGILVEAIREVITYEERLQQPMPDWSGSDHAGGGFTSVLEWESGSIVILDPRKLFGRALKRVEEHTGLHGESTQKLSEIAEKEEGDAEEVLQKTFITFDLGEMYGAEISYIREIVRYENNIRHLPGQANYIEGILNLRSEVIPVINLRKYFKAAAQEAREKLIIIFTHGGRQVGVLVDGLREIKTLSAEKFHSDLPQHIVREQNKRFREVIERIVDLKNEEGQHLPTLILDIPGFMGATVTSAMDMAS